MPLEQIEEMVAAGLSRRVALAADAAGHTLATLLDATTMTKSVFLQIPNVGRTSWQQVVDVRYARSPEGVRAERCKSLLSYLESANLVLDALRADDPDELDPLIHVSVHEGHLVALQKL